GRRVGFADGFPLLVLNNASLDDLNARIEARGHAPLPVNRFRPNIVFGGTAPYAEDRWTRIAIGNEVRLSIVKPCARCAITTTDQTTGVREKEPLATLATFRRLPNGSVVFAQNAIHDAPGTIRVGDAVREISDT